MAPVPSVASSAGSEMGIPQPTTASSAVDNQLKSLCLREFPCGLGTWVKSAFISFLFYFFKD